MDDLSYSGGKYASPGLPLKQGSICIKAEVFLILEGVLMVFLVLFSSSGLCPDCNVDLKYFLSFPGVGRAVVNRLDRCLSLDNIIDGREYFGKSGLVAWFVCVLRVPWG
jgi:hypothetical protein